SEDGYLKFDCVGGIDRRVLLCKPVAVGKNKIPGVIGMKPIHLTTAEERKSIPKVKELYIDIGAKDKEEAEKLVSPGDYVTFSGDIVEFGEGFIKAKALDDRAGCAVMLELLKEDLPMDCTFAFTVQEEIGCKGAMGAAFSVKPEIALILETTTAADLAGVEGGKKVCCLGEGPVVPFMDGGSIADRRLYELTRTLAKENHIPWQTKHMIAGGNDARVIQRSREGVRTVVMSAAVRYLHAPSTVACIRDFDHIYKLARLFIEAVAQKEV
ncbi:MAG: M42 family peptidase, partial [Oscillospiraceae bacterium]|nr:M42 family peptidase [Oscillospiraceae bacterium]